MAKCRRSEGTTGERDKARERDVDGKMSGLCGRDPSVGLSGGHFIMSAMHEVLKNDSLSK